MDCRVEGLMTPDKHRRLKPLFEEALEKSPDQRSAFILKVRLADEELGRELESLVESHVDSGDPLTRTMESPPVRLQNPPSPESPSFAPDELLLDRFRIVRFIGHGGMGEVYEAEDLQLGPVALKTIRTDLVGNPRMLARFRQEVQLARKVTSTNVCRIHELFLLPAGARRGAAAFLTMELLGGVTLAERIDREGALPFPEAEAAALQLCTGVQAIHDAGVIHRDIKSRNVMLVPRKGTVQAVVMDLGLARDSAIGPDAETGLTMPGAIMGTPQYMAPEQFEGTDATAATDVYALGVLLYEMVTGKRPFQASTPIALAVRRGKRLDPASSVRTGVPKHWDEVISRCLKYEPELRYQSADQVAAALRGREPHRGRRLVAYTAAALLVTASVTGIVRAPFGLHFAHNSSPLAGAGPEHLAVLPFTNVGNDPANRVIGDGLLETLTSRLSDLDSSGKTLWVVPAGAVRERKATEPGGAVKQLGVDLVVTGVVQREDRVVRLTVNLVDARKMRQMGSATISGSDGDFPALEDGAVAKLAELLRIDSKDNGTPPHPRADPAAYQQYLEAMGYMHRWDQQGNLDKAITLFANAAKEDPQFHLSLSGLAEAYRLRYSLDHNQKWADLALDAANRALEADAGLESVYVTLGRIHISTGKYEVALEEFERALNLAPRDADAIQGTAQTYQKLGRNKEAEAMLKRAQALQPDAWEGYFRLGNFFYTRSRFLEAESQYRRVLELAPDNASAYTNLGTALTNQNRYSEARAVLEKALALNPTYSGYNNLASVYFLEGRYADSAAIYEKALKLSDADYSLWGNLAAAYAAVPALASRSAAAYEQAASRAENKAREAPDGVVQSSLGEYYAALKMPDKARARLESALALSPADPAVVLSAADAYAALGDREAAKLQLRKAVALGIPLEYAKRIPELKEIAREQSVPGLK